MDNDTRNINKTLLIFILGVLAGLGPFTVDTYIPGFSQMASDFHTGENKVAFTITSYFIGITIGQLAYGPIIDKYGRRKPLLYALILYTLASIGCAVSSSIGLLIVVRFFQALGGSAGMVSAMAIITDVYAPEKRAKAFSMVMLILGVAPIIAPSLGSFIIKYYHWPWVFYALALLGLLLFFLIFFFLPETGKHLFSGRIRIKKALADYKEVLQNKRFLFYALGGSLTNSLIFANIAASPFIFMTYYGLNPTTFGLIYGINAAGVLLGNYINSLLTKRHSYLRILHSSAPFLFFSSFLFASMVFYKPSLPFVWVVLGIFVIQFFIGMIYPNAVAASLVPFTERSGSASALNGSLMMGFSAAVTAVIGILPAHSAFTMFAVMTGLSVAAFVFLKTAKNKHSDSLGHTAAQIQ